MAATENQLSKSAKIFLGVLFALSAILLVPSLAQLSLDTEGWLVFFIFGGAAAAAQLFPVHTLKNNAFTPAIVFMLPAVFLLPPPLIALMPIVMHLPEWLRVRYPWFMQSFNIANHTIDLFAAYAVANLVLDHAPGTDEQVWAMAGVAGDARLRRAQPLDRGADAPVRARHAPARDRVFSRSRASRTRRSSACSASRSSASGTRTRG